MASCCLHYRQRFGVGAAPVQMDVANISTRLQVDTGDSVLIAGFIVTGLEPKRMLIRAVLRGAGDATGLGLVEVYDLDRTVNARLANISTRGLVQTGDNVMIGGFIVLGPATQQVIVRAIGPSVPVAGALPNPTLDLVDGNGVLVGSNDNWRSLQEADIIATGVPPSNDLESAIVAGLATGNYTALVRSVNNGTGIALVEVYVLDH
jgi:hypothetical protein